MAKIEGMALNVVLTLAKKEIMDYCMTTRVGVVSVGFDYDAIESDEDGERTLMVVADVDTDDERFKDCNGVHPWALVWDEETCEFHTAMRWDQDEDDDDGVSPRDLLTSFFATCIDKVKDGEQKTYLKDVIDYYDIAESQTEKAKDILDNYLKKMKEYQKNPTTQEAVARLLDVTARKLILLSDAC